MLVLTRKLGQQIRIGDDITLTIVKTQGNTVRIGIEAPKQVRVLRAELPPREHESERPVFEGVASRQLRSTATRSLVQTDDRRQQVATSTQESTPAQAAHPDRWSVANMRARSPLANPSRRDAAPLRSQMPATASNCRLR